MRAAAASPGRPRSEDVDRAILRATVELLCDSGVDATTIEAVAERAAVGRPSVYRRYRNREALIEAAVRDSFERDVPAPEPSDDAYRDVLDLLDNTVHMLTRTPIGPVLRSVIPHLPRQPRFRKFAQEVGRKRRLRLRSAMKRAIAEGALETDRDLDLLLDGVLGAIYFRYFITRGRVDRAYARTLLETLA